MRACWRRPKSSPSRKACSAASTGQRLESAGLTVTVGGSSMTLAGLLKHLAGDENGWFSLAASSLPAELPLSGPCHTRANSMLIMPTEADVREIALSLPQTTEEQWYQTPGYKVAGKGFLRIRTEAEGGLVVFVADLGEKAALLKSDPDAFYTTPHYDNYPVVLINLAKVDPVELEELIIESWRLKAPPKIRAAFDRDA